MKRKKKKVDTSGRNMGMTMLVLKGYTLSQVGKIYNLTPPRIRQLTMHTCKKFAPTIFNECVSGSDASMSMLRARKNRISTLLQAELKRRTL